MDQKKSLICLLSQHLASGPNHETLMFTVAEGRYCKNSLFLGYFQNRLHD